MLWRDLEPVHSALVESRAAHLENAIDHALKTNRELKRLPTTYTELAVMLNRDKINLWRWRKGHHEPNVSDVVSLAQILGVRLEYLFPPDLASLPTVIGTLCRTLSERDTDTYVQYVRVVEPARSQILDRRGLDDIVSRSGRHDCTREAAAKAIWCVADGLEPVLAAVAELDARRSGDQTW